MSIKSNNDNMFNEINITPLTDIFLVLLIIMMVIAPMFQSINKNINMPQINSGVNVDNDKITVAITKNTEFFLDQEPIKPDQLEQKLSEALLKTKEKVLIVKADTSVKSKEIMKVMNAAQATGFEKLTIAGEPLSKKQQRELENNADQKTLGKNNEHIK